MEFAAWCKANGHDLNSLVLDNEAFAKARSDWQASLPKASKPASVAGEQHLILYVNGKHTAELSLKRGRSKERDTLVSQFQAARDAGITACLIRSDGSLTIEASTTTVTADSLGAMVCGKPAPTVPAGVVKRAKK